MNCEGCSHDLPDTAKFCSQCGLARGAASVASSADREVIDERIQILYRYIPKSLVQHLLKERRAPVGQRSVAAVVFADISGFTSMSEKMEPEQVLKVMNGCFEGLVEAVEKYGGTVDKFIGDCLMAVFGVPVTHADDAERAVRACQDMLVYLGEYNKTLEKPLGLSIGVNYGPLVAGNLGGRSRMDFTVLGDAVNLSQRLEAAANSGQILVSQTVQRASHKNIPYRPLEPIKVKGKTGLIPIFEVIQEELDQPQAPQTVADLRQSAMPCFGREPYLRAIEGGFVKAADRGMIIDLFGETGIGKTRIAEELGKRWKRSGKGGDAVIVYPPGIGDQRPFGALGAMVNAVCGVTGKDGGHKQKTARLHELGIDEGWRNFLTFVASPGEDSHLDTGQLESGILAATRLLFDGLARHGTIVALDATGAYDSQSVAIYKQLWSSVVPQELRVITTRGASDAALFVNSGWARSAEIKALDRDSSSAMAAARLSLDILPGAAERFLAEQAAGNPRYILELIDSLIDAGFIYLAGEQYLVRDDLSAAPRGLTLSSLIASRIDRLTTDQKYLLQGAALYGSIFPGQLVANAVGEPTNGALWLQSMVDQNLLIKRGGEYEFPYDIVQNVATEGLLSDQRSELNGHLGRALEADPLGQTEEALPKLAHFFGASADFEKAAYYLERAGEYLMRGAEYVRGAELFERWADVLPKTQQPSGSDARAWIEAGRCRELAGDIKAAAAAYSKAGNAAQAAQFRKQMAEARRHSARLERLAGRFIEASDIIEGALSMARGARDKRTLAWALLEAAEIDLTRNNAATATAKLEEAREISEGLDSQDNEGSVRGRCLGRLGRLALTHSDTNSARKHLTDAIALCESVNDTRELVRLYGNLGVLAHQSKTGDAQGFFQRAIGIAQQSGDRQSEAKQLHNLGRFMLSAGDRDPARNCFQKSYDLARALDWAEGVAVNSNAIKSLR